MAGNKTGHYATPRTKALLLPMPRQRASELVLRARLTLERLRRGEVDRPLVNQLAQICLIVGFIAADGYGSIARADVQMAEHELGGLLRGFEQTGQWPDRSSELVDSVTAIVNEYDHLLATVRLEIIAQASDHLERLKAIAASSISSAPEKSGTLDR